MADIWCDKCFDYCGGVHLPTKDDNCDDCGDVCEGVHSGQKTTMESEVAKAVKIIMSEGPEFVAKFKEEFLKRLSEQKK